MSPLEEILGGLQYCQNALQNAYYGEMCPGLLEGILGDRDSLASEYEKMSAVLVPIIETFAGAVVTDSFEHILDDLYSGLCEVGPMNEVPPFQVPKYIDTETLPLPFKDK